MKHLCRIGAVLGVILAFPSLSQTAQPLQEGLGYFKSLTTRTENVGLDELRIGMSRDVLYVPKEYGRVIDIQTNGNGYTLWFQDSQDQVRNIVIEGTQLVLIQRKEMLVAPSRTLGY